jgi:outer membrane receptor protein involved in Fe transport
MVRFRTKACSAAVSAALGTMAGGPAAAATPPQETQTITVTAQKREQKLIEVPAAVQAFTGSQLEDAGIQDLKDLVRSIPGASEGRSTSAGTRSFQIRGVTSLYGDSTVGYYLDDAVFTVLNRNWAPVAGTFDVERVEVLRGPQGTLYGLGAMGGSVRFITADPDLKRFTARGVLGYSNTEGGEPNWNVGAALSVPIVKDVLGLRITATRDETGGYAESPTFPGQKNETANEMLRIKLLARPHRDVTLKLGHQRSRTRDAKGNQLEYRPGPNPPEAFVGAYPPALLGTSTPVESFNNSRIELTSLYASYDAGPVLIESSSGHVKAWQGNRVPVNGLILNSGLDASTTSSELRIVSKDKGPLRWIAGAMVLNADSAEDVRLDAVPPPPAVPVLGAVYNPLRNDVPTYDSKSWAVFGEVSWDLLDGKLTPLLGLRYFRDDRTFTDNQRPHTLLPAGAPQTSPPLPPPGPCTPPYVVTPIGPLPPVCMIGSSVNSTSATFDSWNPRFNLSWRPTPGTTAYFNAAKGFRSGVFNSRSTVVAGFPAAVEPDDVWSYEVGGKWALLNNSLFLEAAIYRLDWSDIQLNFNAPGFAPPPPQVVANVGDVRGTGLDYGITWSPMRGLRLSLTGNFNETEFTRIVNPAAFNNTNIFVGNQLVTVPKQTHTAHASYFRALTEDYTLSVHGSYTYIGQQGDPSSVGQGPATRPAPLGRAQKLLGLRVGVDADRWSAYLVGSNLLNHDDPFYISGSGYQRNYPRTVGVEFKFEL